MYMRSISQAEQLVKALTYHPKHRREWWNKPLTDNQRAWVGIITGLMLGWAIAQSII